MEPGVAGAASGVFPLRFGIGDVDSYGMLFYGHYARFSERAANACMVPTDRGAAGGGACVAVLRCAALVKYVRRVAWNDAVTIRSTLVPDPSDRAADAGARAEAPATTERTLFHEWLVDDKPVHLSIATYSVSGGEMRAPTSDTRSAMRIRALQRDAAQIFSPPPQSYRREPCTVYPDQLSYRGGLTLPTIMDLMERQRTDIIGGQAELEKLRTDGDTRIVVYSMQQFALGDVKVAPKEQAGERTVPPPPPSTRGPPPACTRRSRSLQACSSRAVASTASTSASGTCRLAASSRRRIINSSSCEAPTRCPRRLTS